MWGRGARGREVPPSTRARDARGTRRSARGRVRRRSLALDDFVTGRSDIDVAIVTRSELEAPIKGALAARLRHPSLACPARGLELVVYRQEVAASGTPEPGFDLELNSGPRMEARVTLGPRDRPAADGLFWYGLDRSILATQGLALWGTPGRRRLRQPSAPRRTRSAHGLRPVVDDSKHDRSVPSRRSAGRVSSTALGTQWSLARQGDGRPDTRPPTRPAQPARASGTRGSRGRAAARSHGSPGLPAAGSARAHRRSQRLTAGVISLFVDEVGG